MLGVINAQPINSSLNNYQVSGSEIKITVTDVVFNEIKQDMGDFVVNDARLYNFQIPDMDHVIIQLSGFTVIICRRYNGPARGMVYGNAGITPEPIPHLYQGKTAKEVHLAYRYTECEGSKQYELPFMLTFDEFLHRTKNNEYTIAKNSIWVPELGQWVFTDCWLIGDIKVKSIWFNGAGCYDLVDGKPVFRDYLKPKPLIGHDCTVCSKYITPLDGPCNHEKNAYCVRFGKLTVGGVNFIYSNGQFDAGNLDKGV